MKNDENVLNNENALNRGDTLGDENASKNENKRISIKEPRVLFLGFLLAILSAAICMQIMGQFGTAPNTSLIGAVLVMLVARIPMLIAKKFRNLERQNYILSFASASGFAAANCGFVAIATMFMLNRNDLIIPIALGALMGSMISAATMGRIFDSKIFPAKGAWPMGVAVASTIEAGDEGGKKGFELLQGIAVGAIASFFGIPAAGVGIAFIANVITMGALATGMIIRGFSGSVIGNFIEDFDMGQTNIAQGVMIGAGIVAFVQIIFSIVKGNKKEPATKHQTSLQADQQNEQQDKQLTARQTEQCTEQQEQQNEHTVSDSKTIKTFVGSFGLFMAGAVILALVSGVFGNMGLWMAILWVLFAGVTAIVNIVLVGTASMQSGWAPAFAVVTLCLTIGMIIGFPPIPLAVLAGYIGAVGLPLADTGIGLKTGWLIRGKGADKAHELQGRKQQVIIKYIGIFVGIAVSIVFGMILMRSDVIPPMSVFYSTAVESVAGIAVLGELLLWAIPGAILQIIFGSKSAGLMLATGLLINNAVFGITILAAIVLRLIIGTKHMQIRSPGLIAGDGLFGFVRNIFGVFF